MFYFQQKKQTTQYIQNQNTQGSGAEIKKCST